MCRLCHARHDRWTAFRRLQGGISIRPTRLRPRRAARPKTLRGGTYLNFAAFRVRWMKHVRACRDLLRRAFEAANRIGDLTVCSLRVPQSETRTFSSPASRSPTCNTKPNMASRSPRRRGSAWSLILLATQLALIRMLRGATPTFGCFDDGRFDEAAFERHLSEQPGLAMAQCWYWIRKLQARYIAGDYAAAMDAASKAQRLLWTTSRFIEEAEYHFYGALSRAAWCDYASAAERQQHLDAVAAHHRQLQVWAENCPENFENRAALVGAEIARFEGRDLDAERLYEQAIRSARDNGFVNNEAIAYERASAFYRARGFDQIADLYLRNARYCYVRWGADGKVRQLEEMHPRLRTEEPAPGPTNTVGDAGRTPRPRDRDQGVAGRLGRDGAGETDRHADAHGNRASRRGARRC